MIGNDVSLHRTVRELYVNISTTVMEKLSGTESEVTSFCRLLCEVVYFRLSNTVTPEIVRYNVAIAPPLAEDHAISVVGYHTTFKCIEKL